MIKVKVDYPTLNGESYANKRRCTMYAIIETGGKQLRVEEGQTIFVEKLDLAEGEEVKFNTVVAVNNRTLRVGAPYVKGASVTAKVEKQGKSKKIIIFKFKSKKGSTRRKQGHRQPYTKLTVTEIVSS